ncbi:hypothetical protein JW926_13875 [Candidatus Sumerlaeota bacterium]|nr:hypothetical protein [Candidatus Sumerlaeota bacterium]
MIIKQYLMVFLIGLFLLGCATPMQFITPKLTVVDIPKINEEKIAELGDTLVNKGRIYTFNALRLENHISAGDGFLTKKISLEPGILKATMRDRKWLYYTTD